MNYQWYPGHMTKAKRMMQENIKLIDLVIELVDARIPLSSRNPDIDALAKNKSRIILLNKADLADPRHNKEWAGYFKQNGFYVVEINSKSGVGMKSIQGVVQEACREKIERNRKRGIVNRPVRAMVVGIPNVGKSTFINSYAGKACTKTGNKPGVTKGKQWIRLNKGLELLDTPGILWPKFEDQAIGMRLAMVGSINDDILSMEELALELIGYLEKNYQGLLEARYEMDGNGEPKELVNKEMAGDGSEGITENGQMESAGSAGQAGEWGKNAEGVAGQDVDLLGRIGKSRHCFAKGNELDFRKAAGIVIDDFRSGKLGRITLEFPGDSGKTRL